MKTKSTIALIIISVLGLNACGSDNNSVPIIPEVPEVPEDGHDTAVSDEIILAQRTALETNTDGKGFSPQSPRDIDDLYGESSIVFTAELPTEEMNLCNIHFHKNAEHKGGEFTEYAGNGDGHGSGYKYSGSALSEAELTATAEEIGASDHGSLHPGDTIEVHYVHSTAQVEPGPTLGACLSDSITNQQLRVEAQVYVLVNDENALDFMNLTAHDKATGKNQALNIPTNTGTPITYTGSTTGPDYNETGSPFQVSWSVRPLVAKVNIESVGTWLAGNVFEEDHAHGVRNLVQNPKLLSTIE
ncbi:delta-class carbonic anhydrase [Colwellia sp. 20A7]|uniref:delta-class carbonic anhydrase n=1 Tax=Colwellia sp. 20A7 TaxID=2689569 RepID=UPI001358F5E1|nr:delta-class carbonic anhydrase [Colwellia sp. 20A7]